MPCSVVGELGSSRLWQWDRLLLLSFASRHSWSFLLDRFQTCVFSLCTWILAWVQSSCSATMCTLPTLSGWQTNHTSSATSHAWLPTMHSGPESAAEASTGPPAHPLRLDGSCGWSQHHPAKRTRTDPHNGDAALPPGTFSNPCNIARSEIVSYALIPSMDVMVASSSMSQRA